MGRILGRLDLEQARPVVNPRICSTCLTPIPDDAAFCSLCGAPSETRILTPAMSGSGGVRTDHSSSSYATEPEHLQRVIGPNYELGALIGRGGYAEVFAVRDRKLNRDLAIKVLRPDLIVTKSLLARFRREAEAVAALHHRGIVPVYDVGEADGVGFIVMPLIHGESLKKRLLAEHRLPVQEAKRILLEAADALEAAHAAGVVHRDIKPENIMLEGDLRRVLLMDFGIAKAVDTAGDHQLTATGVIVGTPQYMSPEQACGDPNVDHRSDQYSLAVVGYQMLSGRVPFEGETARAIITKQMLDDPPPLWELVDPLPSAMMEALERALSKEPKNRFASIGEFAASLRRESPRVRPMQQKARRAMARASAKRGRPWIAWATGVFAIVLATVALTQFTPGRAVRTPRPETTFIPVNPPVVSAPPASPVSPEALLAKKLPRVLPAPPPAPVPLAATPSHEATKPATTLAESPTAPPPTPATCASAFDAQDWASAYVVCQAEAKQDAVAARRAGLLLADGKGGAEDKQGAMVLLATAAAKGDPLAIERLNQLRVTLAKQLEQTEPSQATEYYLQAARAGHLASYPIVAARYENGIGTPLDLGEAVRWYEKAAAAGHPASQVHLAGLYARGVGVGKDQAKAAEWYRKAAEAGDPEGMFQLGSALLAGRGVARSEEEGRAWIDKAARAGHEAAKHELERHGR
jgi:serine/threonine-protein kinase